MRQISPEFRFLKVEVFFINLINNSQGAFPPHEPELPTTSIFGKTDFAR